MFDYTSIIKKEIPNCLTATNLPYKKKYSGKVRDIFEADDKLILVTTDRQSAFDRILAAIPFKGQVLNLISSWWFNKTKHIIPNHIQSIPDPNVSIVKKCTIFPVEFVVRGYITGTSNTSLWTHYNNGAREYCGHSLPEDLRKNQALASPILTPTTKDEKHDALISHQEIIEQNLMTEEQFEQAKSAALKLFACGSEVAKANNLILVDTKYEMGLDENNNVVLVDELHTPDSSRYWLADTYHERFNNKEEPDNIDKEFLRLWFTKNCDPYNDKVLPEAPEELVIELSKRYIKLYEMIVGEKFAISHDDKPVLERIKNNLNNYFVHEEQICAE